MVESSTVDFGFSTEVKVRFAETDAQGIAHHAVYLVWFEVARIEYLARFRGGYPALQAEGIEALTLEANVSFRAPARFDDRLVISAKTADHHVQHIYTKIGVSTRGAAALFAIEHGVVVAEA